MTEVVATDRRVRAGTPRSLVDRLSGRVTMYRLMTLVLGGLAAGALLLSAVGLVAFPPLGLLAALAVAVVVGWGTNRLFAAARGLRPHAESGLITGLLGFFLFLPLPTLPALAALAGAIAAANATKYLLVVRGRHVLNPVAAGAVVVLLTGLSGATWWVATPALLPVLLVGGALVVHRSGGWSLAGPVLAITVVGTALQLVLAGSAPLPALWTAAASYPWLFLAAFMATEPLTAPPRRRQRLLVGALVGVLALLPLQVGGIAMTPEIALVLGNVVAFGFGPRRRIRLVLEQRVEHPGRIAELRLRSETPLRVLPGQYLELSLPHVHADLRGQRRAFSPAGAPGGTAVRVLTRTASPSSSFKRTLLALPPGTAVAGSVVAGDFVPPRDPSLPVLHLAAGIGVTPFLAMAQAEPHRDAVLVWALRADDDPGWAAAALSGVRVLVAAPHSVPLPPRWKRIGERVDLGALLASVPDVANRIAYASGSPAWVAEARRLARDAGARRIRTDRFLGT